MSDNKGKDGEMVVVELGSHLGRHFDIDLRRPTTTNTADSGIDLVMEGDFPKVMENLASGSIESFNLSENGEVPVTTQTRIDVKNVTGKIGVNTVRKFVTDIHKSPDIDGHALLGGDALTKAARQVIEKAQEAHNLTNSNINIFYSPMDKVVDALKSARKLTIQAEIEEQKIDELCDP